jgi:PAS domain S-box-containing protein
MAGTNNNNCNCNGASTSTSLNDSLKALIEQHGYEACEAALHDQQQQKSTKEDDDDESYVALIMESILNASLDAAFVTDESGMIQRVNQAAVDQFGFQLVLGPQQQQQHLSQVLVQLFQEESSSTTATTTTTMSSLDTTKRRQESITAKRADDGTEFLVFVGLQRVPRKNDTSLWVVFCHDLTRHQRQMSLIEQYHDWTTTRHKKSQIIMPPPFWLRHNKK